MTNLRKKYVRAFTLIELLLVLAIVSLASAAAFLAAPAGTTDAKNHIQQIRNIVLGSRELARQSGAPVLLAVEKNELHRRIWSPIIGDWSSGVLSTPHARIQNLQYRYSPNEESRRPFESHRNPLTDHLPASSTYVASIIFFPDGVSTGGDLDIHQQGRKPATLRISPSGGVNQL